MRSLVAVALLSLVLAGCFGGDDAGPGPTQTNTSTATGTGTVTTTTTTTGGTAPPPSTVRLLTGFSMTDCIGVSLGAVVPLADIQAMLPEGYTASATFQAPLPLDADQGTVFADLLQCGNFTAANSVFPGVWFGRMYTPIDAPEAFPDVASDAYLYTFSMVAGEDILSVLWPAAGLAMINGSVAATVSTATVDFAVDDLHWQTAAPAPQTPAGTSSFVWFHVTEAGGTVVWTGNETSAVGSGTGTFASGSGPFSGLGTPAGTLVGPVQRHEGTSFTDMVMVLHTPPA